MEKDKQWATINNKKLWKIKIVYVL
jgi:hypothetical protein